MLINYHIFHNYYWMVHIHLKYHNFHIMVQHIHLSMCHFLYIIIYCFYNDQKYIQIQILSNIRVKDKQVCILLHILHFHDILYNLILHHLLNSNHKYIKKSMIFLVIIAIHYNKILWKYLFYLQYSWYYLYF